MLDVSPRSKLFDSQTTFLPTLSDIEALLILKQTRNLADDNLFGGLRVKAGVPVRKSKMAESMVSRSSLVLRYDGTGFTCSVQ